ncbi:hypothetical protein BgiBS90_018029, partial [Biomphalaria glabrata]
KNFGCTGRFTEVVIERHKTPDHQRRQRINTTVKQFDLQPEHSLIVASCHLPDALIVADHSSVGSLDIGLAVSRAAYRWDNRNSRNHT